MAYPPPDPRNTAGPSAFANARLTLEEAERLAATFQPSWQVDEQPVNAHGEATDPDLYARQSSSAAADSRATVQALNGNHQPPSATVRQAPDVSVIVDPAIVAPEAARAARPVQTRTLVMSTGAAADPRLRGAARAAAMAVPLAASRSSRDIDEGELPRRSKMGLWIGLAAALVAVVGVAVWLASGSEEKAVAPAPAVQKPQPAVETRVAAPPHPPETPAATPIPAAPPPAQVPPPTQPAVATPVTATPLPAAVPVAPPPRLVVPPAPRQPTWTPPPVARPAARPKPAAPTIVRDVPF